MHRHAHACVHMMDITPTHPCAVPIWGYPPIHIGTYTYVCLLCTHSVGYPPTTHVPTRTYHCAYTYVYMQVPVLLTRAMVLVCAWVLRGGTYVVGALRISCAAQPCSVTPSLPALVTTSGCLGAARCGRLRASEGRLGGLAGPRTPLRGVLSHSEGPQALRSA